jgi:hypothetical protein
MTKTCTQLFLLSKTAVQWYLSISEFNMWKSYIISKCLHITLNTNICDGNDKMNGVLCAVGKAIWLVYVNLPNAGKGF